MEDRITSDSSSDWTVVSVTSVESDTWRLCDKLCASSSLSTLSSISKKNDEGNKKKNIERQVKPRKFTYVLTPKAYELIVENQL